MLNQFTTLLTSKFDEFGRSMNARFSAVGAEFLSLRSEIDSRFSALEKPNLPSAPQSVLSAQTA